MPAWLLAAEWFSERYGFTPDEVRGLPIEAEEWYPRIAEARARAAKILGNQQNGPGGR